MADLSQAIRERLAVLEPASLELVDESAQHVGHAGYREGHSTHFRLTIVSERFRGKNRVQRHREVYGALGNLMQEGGIHALAVRAVAPDEI